MHAYSPPLSAAAHPAGKNVTPFRPQPCGGNSPYNRSHPAKSDSAFASFPAMKRSTRISEKRLSRTTPPSVIPNRSKATITPGSRSGCMA